MSPKRTAAAALSPPETRPVTLALEAAGWTFDGTTWTAPGGSSWLDISDDGEGAPFYGVTVRAQRGEGGTLYTHNAGRVLEFLGMFGLIAPPDDLDADTVAEIWTDERRKTDPDAQPYTKATVLSYIEKSKPGGDDRYLSRPVPRPRYAGIPTRGRPYWRPYQEPDLRAWLRSRPGAGAGGGRRRSA